MVDRDVTYGVWRDVPGWETGEADRLRRMYVRRAARHKTRYIVLGGPGGQMAMVPVGSPMLNDRYANWFRLTALRVRGHVDYARRYRIYDAVCRVWGLA